MKPTTVEKNADISNWNPPQVYSLIITSMRPKPARMHKGFHRADLYIPTSHLINTLIKIRCQRYI